MNGEDFNRSLWPVTCRRCEGRGIRVLEVDDIYELLTGIQAEPEDRLGALEPSTGNSFLNAFKGADFDPIDDDEKPE